MPISRRLAALFESRACYFYCLIHASYLFPSSFMWGNNSCWDLAVMDCFLISPSEVASLVLTIQPLSFPFVADVSPAAHWGLCADIELWEESALIKLIDVTAAWNRCCLILVYNIARALTAVLHVTFFPAITLAATLLFANYVSQHALVMPRSCVLPSEDKKKPN